jgi:hypothetical protein
MTDIAKDKPLVQSVDKSKEELERHAKYHLDRDVDLFEIKGGDPDTHYVWIQNRKERVEMKKLRGYEIVSDAKLKTLGRKAESTQHELGDLVLMKLPKDIRERRVADMRSMAKSRRERVREEFIDEAKRAGLKPFDESRDER